MLKHTSKRLSYALVQLQETYKCSSTQARDLQTNRFNRKLFEFKHLIYNQWCSQYKSITDSLDSWDNRISKSVDNS